MATHATTVAVGVVAATVTFPAPSGPAQRHQRVNVANIGTVDAWMRVDGTATAAIVEGDECACIPAGTSIELEWRVSASAISTGATKLNMWGRP